MCMKCIIIHSIGIVDLTKGKKNWEKQYTNGGQQTMLAMQLKSLYECTHIISQEIEFKKLKS